MLVGACSPAESSIVIPVDISVPEVSVTSTPEPEVIATPRPPVYPHPEPVPTPMPEYSQAVQVTAEIVVDRCWRYAEQIEYWLEWEHNGYHILTTEDIPLILSVMANESACNPYVVSSRGAIGVMQIMPKPYYPTCLYQTACNIHWGIWILDRAIEMHGLEMGLAAYNCSLEGIENNACGPTGGIYYSERVREFWLPFFEEYVWN